MTRIGIVDYGVGNLFSLRSSLAAIGVEPVVSGDPAVLAACERIILPGVGAFGDAADKLREGGLDQFLIAQAKAGKPLMGICLGMQLLFEKSYEFGEHRGLGLLRGSVVPMVDRIPAGAKVPQIGWNALTLIGDRSEGILKHIKNGDCVYFVHSFFATDCEDSLAATTNYYIDMTAAVSFGNVSGCQFHPEKSGEVGLRILRAFCGVDEPKTGGTIA
ncbi:MAG: imidazole glycerol phosphate synthase subunit HisH [Clostridia bacterium]|nr:imidazole glycerol phosphate synthase subunit HisH [Clostridia bacterium]